MSILEGCQRFPLDRFNGAKPYFDAEDLQPGDALLTLNCKFAAGKVQTRTGLKAYLTETASDVVTSALYYAYGQAGIQKENFAYLDQTPSTGDVKVKVQNVISAGSTTILTRAGTISAKPPLAVFSSVSARLYMALTQYDTAGAVSARTPYVWDEITLSTMIECFQRPMKTTEVTEALTQPSAGVVTAGTHYVGVLFQTKAGYWTSPGPADGTTLALTAQSIVSTGTNNILVTLTPASTWPAWIKAVQVIMTTAQNNFQYYTVPGTITAVTSGSSTVYAISVNIADEHLTSTGSQGAGTLADDYFGLLHMDASNAQPFYAKAVIGWGQRMVWVVNYGGNDVLFASEPLNPEWISADQHILQLPNGKPIGSVFVMRGVLYAVSTGGGLYSWVDNGGRPVTFSPPTTVDERISVTGFYSTTVAASGGYALIVGPQGLYAFSGGSFPRMPISYYQSPTWDTINWSTTAEEIVQVIDMTQDQMVLVKLRVFEGTKILTWDYSEGMTPGDVKYSRWTPSLSAVTTPSMALIRRVGVWELLVGSSNVFYRLQSEEAGDTGTTLYTDFTSSGIDWQYQTAPLPILGDSPMMQHLACRVRALGLTGTPGLYFTMKTLDDTLTITSPASPVTLATSPGGPGKEFLFFYDSQTERISYIFTNNATAGAGIVIARLTHFYNFFTEQR